MNIRDLITEEGLASIYSGERKGCHSSRHWHNVGTVGLMLAYLEGADPTVPLLFSVYHDCRRSNDGYDPEHGLRASRLAISHYALGHLKVNSTQLDKLVYACVHHSDGLLSPNDLEVACCWDADRIDLVRVGFEVDASLLTTSSAKKLASNNVGIYSGVCDCG